MPDVGHVTVPTGAPVVAWGSTKAGTVTSVLFYNVDLNNYVYLGTQSTITPGGPGTIPIPPNGTFSGDASQTWFVVGSAAGISPLVVVPNGQAFFLGISQGMGNLAIPSLQSPNFVTGVSGWQISKLGDAEFNSIIIRGGESIGGVNLYYNGTPAYGNLAFSISSVPGEDEFGNFYDAGVNAYSPSVATQLFAGQQNFFSFAADIAVNLQMNGYGALGINGDPGGSLIISVPVQPPLTAVEPGTGTPAGTTATTETWHNAGLSNGWINTAGFAALRYKLTIENTVHVVGVISATSATATTFTTLPAGYVPSQGGGVGVGATGGVPAGDIPNVRWGANSGALVMNNAGTVPVTQTYFINVFIPLD